jgi:hypothetical protein
MAQSLFAPHVSYPADKAGLQPFRFPLTGVRMTQKLRSLLGVNSRREFNAVAAQRWKAIKGDFEKLEEGGTRWRAR